MVSNLLIKLKETTYLGKSKVTDGKIHSLSLHRHTFFSFLQPVNVITTKHIH